MDAPHAARAGRFDRRSSDSDSSRTRRLSSSGAPLSGSNSKHGVRGEEAHDPEKAPRAASSSPQLSEEHSPQSAIGEKGGAGAAADPKLVTWSGPDDPANPQNWSTFKKWQVILVASTCSLCVTNNSSIVASNYEPIGVDFGISRTVAILGLSLFVTGLGIGPVSEEVKLERTEKRGQII